MAPQSWTTPEEAKFLLSYKNEFLKTQLQAQTGPLFEKINHEWFKRFSEKDRLFPGVSELMEEQKVQLGEAVEKRKKQIKNWLRNHTHTKGRAVLSMTKCVNKMLTDKAKGTRGPPTNEIAMKLLYEDQVKPVVRAGIDAGLYTTKGEKLMAVRILTAAALQEAGPDVMAAALSLKCEKSKKKEKDNDGVVAPRTNDEYAVAQADFPIIAGQWCNMMEALTGCSFSIFMGGPDPRLDGEINVVSYHTGTAESGTTFSRVNKDFDARYTKPWSDFLESVYPAPLRKLRALGVESHLLDTPSAPSTSGLLHSTEGTTDFHSTTPDGDTTWTMSSDALAFSNSDTSGLGVDVSFDAYAPDALTTHAPLENGNVFSQSAGLDASSADFVWDDRGLPPLPAYTYPASTNHVTSPSSSQPPTPIRSFLDEMLWKPPTSIDPPALGTPPRLRYAYENTTISAPIPAVIPAVPTPIPSAPLAKSAPSLSKAKAKPKPRPIKRVQAADGISSPPAQESPSEVAARPSPPVNNQKRKHTSIEPTAATAGEPEASNEITSNRRRSTRTIIPSSRQEEANKIGGAASKCKY
ncbi:hypothetical protein BJ138DRAFT_1120602 [Hygrophoropsis aurantiaca]|uniref:Uncharacterized protein n=1 Tax=Hygrophoropsis aurantiaca TaxID=72124 RepID=A0ACB7ZQV0_9AGAM|nr:hypothetical protein BJ138DRAFT_1120602 [Hygrophoropsis aurantiaca]